MFSLKYNTVEGVNYYVEEGRHCSGKSILGRLYIWDYTWFCCPLSPA